MNEPGSFLGLLADGANGCPARGTSSGAGPTSIAGGTPEGQRPTYRALSVMPRKALHALHGRCTLVARLITPVLDYQRSSFGERAVAMAAIEKHSVARKHRVDNPAITW